MNRIHLLDELRGFAIFCMVFYHAFFTMAYFFNFKPAYLLFNFFTPIEPIFAGLFILISGICSKLSKSNFKRGIKLLLIALLISAVTCIFIPQAFIAFGILHMLSLSMIIFSFLERFLNKVPLTFGFTISLILFCITFPIGNGYIGLFNFHFIDIPSSWYNCNFLFPFGVYNCSFSSSDYFPLFPWIFLFFAGSFLGQLAHNNILPKFMYELKFKFFSLLGRHSLLIYILHQPIIYFICYLINLVYFI